VRTEPIDTLVDAAEDAGVEYRTNYSGRGMYGAECFAIEGNTSDLIRFLRKLDDDMADELSDPSTDSMGLDIIFYWRFLRTKESRFL
jgi:hypothetical protein